MLQSTKLIRKGSVVLRGGPVCCSCRQRLLFVSAGLVRCPPIRRGISERLIDVPATCARERQSRHVRVRTERPCNAKVVAAVALPHQESARGEPPNPSHRISRPLRFTLVRKKENPLLAVPNDHRTRRAPPSPPAETMLRPERERETHTH